MREQYTLPINITNGLGWTSQGTINLGSTQAKLNATTAMPENDGKIYCWKDEANPQGGSYVREIGSIISGDIVLNGSALDPSDRILLTITDDEIIAVEEGMSLYLPADAILTVTNGNYVGKFIMVADRYQKSYISSYDTMNKFSHCEGEGFILDNVLISAYLNAGIRLSKGVSAVSHIENTLFDETGVNGLEILSTYTGTITTLNNIFDGILKITDLNSSATVDIRNNIIQALILDSGSTDFTDVIRNNYINTAQKLNSETLPTIETIPNWYTIDTLEEMENYRGNITGTDPIPESYGYIQDYGKVGLGVNGGLNYLDQLDELDSERLGERNYRIKWTKKQPQIANSYRVRMSIDESQLPYFMPMYIDAGDMQSVRIYNQMTLTGYPSDNDGDSDGIADSLFNFKSNRIWYFAVQAQMLLGERLLVHLSEASPLLAIPIRELGEKPDYSYGLDYPIRLVNGEFKTVQRSDSIKAGIYQTVMTNVGERILHNRGAGLRPFIFEGTLDPDLMDLARQHIRSELEAVEPRIRVNAIQFKIHETGNNEKALVVDISYTDLESGNLDTQAIGLPYGTF